MDALLEEAKDIEKSAQVDLHDAANKLLQFTNDYSTDLQLKKRALKLNWDILGNDKQRRIANPGDFTQEISAILQSILLRIKADPEEITNFREDLEKSRQIIIQSAVKDDLVFVGKGLSYQYDESEFSLQPYDIELRLGEITSVVGENSSGKSTLIKVVAGEHLAKTGEVSYPLFSEARGKHIDWREVKRNIAYIPQQLEPWSGIVLDYLRFTLAIKGVYGQQNIDEVDYIIHRLGLTEFVSRTWNELSGGARMRVELARALIWKPKLLILDEPLANLDINAQAIFLRDLKQLANSHKSPVSVLITSQHLYEMENIANRTIFLKKGLQGSNSIGEVVFNDFTANFGQQRQYNSYEIHCKHSLDHVRSLLLKYNIADVFHHGQYYIIKTPLNIDARNMLGIFIENDLTPGYFRDTSTSTRTLFETL